MNVVVKKKVGIIFTQIPLYIIYKFNEIAQQMKSNSLLNECSTAAKPDKELPQFDKEI